MRILIVTESLPPAFFWHPSNPVRGTEQFYVETAKWLAAFGHDVVVEVDGITFSIDLDGVVYSPRNLPIRTVVDSVLLANWRGPVPNGIGEPRIVRWTAFADFRLDQQTFRDCDATVVISNYAAELAGDGTADSPELYVVPLGIDKDFWQPPVPMAQRSKKCLYTSSPDRGGVWLKSWWDYVQRETGFELVCSPYGSEPWSRIRLRSECQAASYWLHPGRGRELFCLSGAEAQACGAVPIIVPNEALTETVRWGHRFPADKYLSGLVSVLKSDYVSGVNADHILSWEQATRKMEEVLKS